MKTRGRRGPGPRSGFTLTEMLVSIAVLVVFVLFTARLFTSAAAVTTAGNKRVDANSSTRPILDRMQVDIAAMIKRADLDYYVKDSANTQPGNDRMAFFAEVPGYYPASGSQSSVSLVSYRVNSDAGSSSFHRFERLAKGLLWNGVSTTETPLVFLPLTIASIWPAATNDSADADYELFGAQVFRFEYFYRLSDGSLSATPWSGATGHTTVSGFQDVTSLEIAVAVINHKSRAIVSDAQLTDLTAELVDFDPSTMRDGDLLAAWQAAANATTNIPRAAASSLHFAHRTFPIAPR